MGELRRSVIKHAAGRWPGPAAVAADAVAAATYRLRPGMDPPAVARLLPHLDADGVAHVLRESWAGHLRTRAWESSIDAPGVADPSAPVVMLTDPAALPTPAVLVFFHTGPVRALRELMIARPGTLLLARSAAASAVADVVPVSRGPAGRSAVVARAVRALRDGRLVAGAVDDLKSTTEVAATLFGRPVRLARGPFAIARMARVPLVPVIATWHGRRPAIVAGEPVDSADEPEAVAAVAGWFEAHLRRHPGDIGPKTLRTFA